MSVPRRPSSGRTATLLVLVGLLLVTCAGVYILFAHFEQQPRGGALGVVGDEESLRLEEARRLMVLLTILLISALLILLFVLGAYLLIRVGRMVARTRMSVGGKATKYVDAWQNYRLTDEQIAAATSEDRPRSDDDDDVWPPETSGDEDPDQPPSTS